MAKTASNISSDEPARGEIYSRYKTAKDPANWWGVVVLGVKRHSRYGKNCKAVVIRALMQNLDGSFSIPPGAQRSEMRMVNFSRKMHRTGASLNEDLLKGDSNKV